MRKPISLWIFGIGGIVYNLLSMVILFTALIMPAQYYSFFIPFVAITILLLLFLIASSIEMFKLKKGGKNIFVGITLLMSPFLILFFSVSPIIAILLVIFLLVFVAYFLNPSIRRLFN